MTDKEVASPNLQAEMDAHKKTKAKAAAREDKLKHTIADERKKSAKANKAQTKAAAREAALVGALMDVVAKRAISNNDPGMNDKHAAFLDSLDNLAAVLSDPSAAGQALLEELAQAKSDFKNALTENGKLLMSTVAQADYDDLQEEQMKAGAHAVKQENQIRLLRDVAVAAKVVEGATPRRDVTGEIFYFKVMPSKMNELGATIDAAKKGGAL